MKLTTKERRNQGGSTAITMIGKGNTTDEPDERMIEDREIKALPLINADDRDQEIAKLFPAAQFLRVQRFS